MASQKTLIESELLVLQHKRGEPGALERLVELWERALYYYVRRLVETPEEAKDIAQDVWCKVIRKLRSVRDPAAFPAWLFKIARTQAISRFRKADPFAQLSEEELPVDAFATDTNGFSVTLNAEELHWGLTQLTPPHSECLVLHFLEGFTLDEVSDITGVAPGTVKSRIHYAKKALREVLEREGENYG
jgi:RNA polymerase sigma-70 factor, ECF subfamily